MVGRKFKLSITSLGAALAALCGGAECHAQLCNLFNRPAPQVAVTTYRPVLAAAPVAAQTVNYMPYTGYRTVYMPTAVTTMQPTAACNACGGATTVMRPVVTYAMRPQLVPYTTYQPVVAAPALVAAPACSACSAGYAPRVTAQYAPVAATAYASPMAAPSLAPAYSAAPAPGCGCSAGAPSLGVQGYAPGPGQIGSTVSSLAGSASVPPALPMNQPVPGPPTPTYPQPSYPQPSYPQSSGSSPTTTFAPGGANYGGTVLAPGTTLSYPSSPTYSSGTILGPPQPVTPAGGATQSSGGAASSSGGAASRLQTPGTSSGATPKSTFKDPTPIAPSGTPSAPSPRWTDRFINPGDRDAGSQGAPADGGSGGPSGGGVGNPKETNFQQPRPVDPEDRMASSAIRQTTIYRSVSSDPVANVALDDDAWHSISPRQ